MKVISRIVNGLTNSCGFFAGVALVFMLAHIVFDVIGKYFFNTPVPATLTFVSNYYMVAVIFLPLAYVERSNQHISVDVLTQRFPPSVRKHLYSFTYLVSAAVFILLTWITYGDAMKNYELGKFTIEQGARISIWQGKFALPIGFCLISIILVLRFIGYITAKDYFASETELNGTSEQAND